MSLQNVSTEKQCQNKCCARINILTMCSWRDKHYVIILKILFVNKNLLGRSQTLFQSVCSTYLLEYEITTTQLHQDLWLWRK